MTQPHSPALHSYSCTLAHQNPTLAGPPRTATLNRPRVTPYKNPTPLPSSHNFVWLLFILPYKDAVQIPTCDLPVEGPVGAWALMEPRVAWHHYYRALWTLRLLRRTACCPPCSPRANHLSRQGPIQHQGRLRLESAHTSSCTFITTPSPSELLLRLAAFHSLSLTLSARSRLLERCNHT